MAECEKKTWPFIQSKHLTAARSWEAIAKVQHLLWDMQKAPRAPYAPRVSDNQRGPKKHPSWGNPQWCSENPRLQTEWWKHFRCFPTVPATGGLLFPGWRTEACGAPCNPQFKRCEAIAGMVPRQGSQRLEGLGSEKFNTTCSLRGVYSYICIQNIYIDEPYTLPCQEKVVF